MQNPDVPLALSNSNHQQKRHSIHTTSKDSHTAYIHRCAKYNIFLNIYSSPRHIKSRLPKPFNKNGVNIKIQNRNRLWFTTWYAALLNQQRRLASPIGADQTKGFAFRNAKGNTLSRPIRSKVFSINVFAKNTSSPLQKLFSYIYHCYCKFATGCPHSQLSVDIQTRRWTQS